MSGRHRGRVARALSAGVVPDYRTASGLLYVLLDGNRAELPRFFNG